VEFVVDTGFVGFLTLPPAAIAALRLPFLRRIAANLADDSTIHVSVHAATIIWDGEEREVEILATGSRPLLGTLLLGGHSLTVWFTEGGMVSVESL
jgi:clan AA aspartic protease